MYKMTCDQNATEFKTNSKMPDSTLRMRKVLIFITILSLSLSCSVAAQNRKIAIFGSSVANGSGDTTGAGGYAGLIEALLEKKGWEVVNISRGGDNTTKILPRFELQLLPEKPKYVIIGLSLGNEGIATNDELARSRSFEKYRSGMLRLIQLCRQNNMYPVVVNCYSRMDFGEEQFEAIKQMNLIVNTWEVPSINVLGPIDNGKGNWLEGYYHDKAHPDYKGHQEMFYAFVPDLFDAIEAGKTQPFRIRGRDCLKVCRSSSTSPLTYTPAYPVHSFSLSFLAKTAGEGTLAVINGGAYSSIQIKNGKLIYHSEQNRIIACDTTGENKGWQYITLTHQYASGLTSFYINGKLAGTLNETIGLIDFVLGGPGKSKAIEAPAETCYKDLLIYRSVLNSDEVKALYNDQLLQSSLEVYAPLNDKEFRVGTCAANYAQSLSELIIGCDLISTKY